MAVGELAVNVTARTRRATKNITGFRKEVKLVGPVVSGLNSKLRALPGRLLAVGAAAVSIRAVASGIADTADEIDKTAKFARRLDILPEKLTGIQHAAFQTAGITENTLNTAMQRMVRRVSEAAEGTGEAQAALRELGIEAKALNRLSTHERLFVIADAMSQVKTQADRVRLSVKLFDTEGAALAVTLAKGSGPLRRYVREAKQLGGTFTAQEAERVEKFNDAMDRLKKTLGGTFKDITIDIAPAAASSIDALREAIQGAKILAKGDPNKEPSFLGKLGSKLNPANSFEGRLVGRAQDALYRSLAKGGPKETEAASPERLAQLQRDALLSDREFQRRKAAPQITAAAKEFVSGLVGGFAKGTVSASKGSGAAAGGIRKGFDAMQREYFQLLLGKGTGGLLGKRAPGAAEGGAGGSSNPRHLGLVGDVGINSAINARSAAGMAALRANFRSKDDQAAAKAAVKTKDNTEKMASHLENLVKLARNPPTISIPRG